MLRRAGLEQDAAADVFNTFCPAGGAAQTVDGHENRSDPFGAEASTNFGVPGRDLKSTISGKRVDAQPPAPQTSMLECSACGKHVF